MQLSYSLSQAVARVGLVADTSLVQDILSYQNPAAEVKVGCAVTAGSAHNFIVHPDAAAEVTSELAVKGVVVASHEIESVNDGEIPGYAVKSVVPVMRKGRIWVYSATAITEGTSTVNVVIESSGSETQLGAFRGAANSTFTAVLPKSKWKSSTTSANQLAILELDL